MTREADRAPWRHLAEELAEKFIDVHDSWASVDLLMDFAVAVVAASQQQLREQTKQLLFLATFPKTHTVLLAMEAQAANVMSGSMMSKTWLAEQTALAHQEQCAKDSAEAHQEFFEISTKEIAQLKTALQSIANSSCCGSCQEAALVAKAALHESRRSDGEELSAKGEPAAEVEGAAGEVSLGLPLRRATRPTEAGSNPADSHSSVSPSPAPRIVATLSEQIRSLRWSSHYAHHDPKGTAGANCPACQDDWAERDRRDKLAEQVAALDAALHHATEERASFRAGSLFLQAELTKARQCANDSADASQQFFEISTREIAQLKEQVASLRLAHEHKVEEIDRLNQILRVNDATISTLTNERDEFVQFVHDVCTKSADELTPLIGIHYRDDHQRLNHLAELSAPKATA
jgi:hypothetical protein